jgi:hypothetical protein
MLGENSGVVVKRKEIHAQVVQAIQAMLTEEEGDGGGNEESMVVCCFLSNCWLAGL